MYAFSRFLLFLPPLALLACGTATPEGEIRDITEILEGEVELRFDPSATAATLRATTTLEVACTVAYGETEALGRLATDEDMQGGGHTDHTPRLTGLLPQTGYFYRLQGSDAAGQLYQGEVTTFTTPVADADPRPGPNVAVNAVVVDFSSEFDSGSFAAENALDGDPGTEWSSRGDGDAAYLSLDLGSPTEVIGVGFRTRSMSDGTSITQSFSVTVDGSQTFGPFPAGEGLQLGTASFTGQLIRFDVETSTGGNTGAKELEVYVSP